jgi:hypothetical protein
MPDKQGKNGWNRLEVIMPSSPISMLPEKDQQELLTDLNYLNTAEIKSFCRCHSIPYTIAIEANSGRRRKTNEDDRKGVILDRVRHFLKTGIVLQETCFPAKVACFDAAPEKLSPDHKLFYGQYDKTNRALIAILKALTHGRFRDGAIARILARDFWSRGEAPTFNEYAAAWLRAVKEHSGPNSEWAFLSDRVHGTAGPDWKRLRAEKAKKVIRALDQILPQKGAKAFGWHRMKDQGHSNTE